MSRKPNPASIGIFVVGAIILAVVSILLFGSGRFFSKRVEFIMYFDDSINGLDIGAPVKFKGVNIGQVSSIYVRHNQIEESVSIPVVIEIDIYRLMNELGVEVDLGMPEEFNYQVEFNGLRARLMQASYVTGLLFIELDYYPNATPPQRKQDPNSPQYLEIPTIASEFTEVLESAVATLNSISKINFGKMGRSAENILLRLDQGLKEIEFDAINNEIIQALQDINALVNNPDLAQALNTLELTLQDGRKTLQGGRKMIDSIDQQLEPLVAEVKLTTEKARETLDSFQNLSENASSLLEPDARLQINIEEALQEVRDAAKSIRYLTEFIEQNPSSFLTGKQSEGE